jgi:fructose-1,6-bisphosphatase
MLFHDTLMEINTVKVVVSEEDDNITVVNAYAIYTVAYDPIDGSSNIDLNIPIGSIFGVYSGDNIIMYYIIATNNEVTMFALDNANQC